MEHRVLKILSFREIRDITRISFPSSTCQYLAQNQRGYFLETEFVISRILKKTQHSQPYLWVNP